MIVLEALYQIFSFVFYLVTRPVIWLITARDCRHCKHGTRGNMSGWYCSRTHIPTKNECYRSSWRRHFERENERYIFKK